MRIVTGHQPAYLPWGGLLHKISLADVFVFMDDVQYLEQDWNNRNRVKGPNGPFWLTVPVRSKASVGKRLRDVLISSDGWESPRHWQRLHWRSMQSCYGRAPYWDTHAPFFEDLYTRKPWKWLVDVNESVLRYLLEALEIGVEWVCASTYGFDGVKSDLVLDHCRKLRGDVCVVGALARDYLVADRFFHEGVSVYYQDYRQPVYRQRFGGFISNLSVVDLLFNCGPASRSVLMSCNVGKADLIAAAGRRSESGAIEPARPRREVSGTSRRH